MAMEVEKPSAAAKESGLGFPYWKPIRRKFPPESHFFSSGNIERELLAKQVALDLTEAEKHELHSLVFDQGRKIFCPIVGCGAHLNSMDDFENHYNARHMAACSVCSRVYPTSRLLSIHVSEAHDSFFRAKVARGYPVFECLVEGCGLKFKNYRSRHQHLVDKHKFPTSFEFLKKARPSRKQRKKSQRKQTNCEKEDVSSSMDIEDETINDLVSAVSKLSTSDKAPSSVSFGRRHARGLTFVPRSLQRERQPNSASHGANT